MNAIASSGTAALERPYFFPTGTQRLFGVWHPASGATGRGAVLFCHALAEEKLWSHRVYVSFARELARRGYSVLRFDCRGEGDSELEFELTNVATRVEDTVEAFRELRALAGPSTPIVLVGHRLGGNVALAAARQLGNEVAGVAVWDPLLDGRDYFLQLLRSNLTTQMATEGKVTRNREALVEDLLAGGTIVVDGYGLTADLYRGISELNLAAAVTALSTPCLLLEIAKAGQTEPSAPLAALCANRPQMNCVSVEEAPFWRETRLFHRQAARLPAATAQWLNELFAVAS